MPHAGAEEHDHPGHDLNDILGDDKHARAELARDADSVLGVVGLVLTCGGVRHYQVPVHHRGIHAVTHLARRTDIIRSHRASLLERASQYIDVSGTFRGFGKRHLY